MTDSERQKLINGAEPARDVFMDMLTSLIAAVSLLKAGGKEAAPSAKMFDQMILDYERAIERGRAAALAQPDAKPRCPRCGSSDPARHPAVQFEGEVQICPHPFHGAQSNAEPKRVTDEMVKAASDVLFDRTSIAFGGTYMREALEAALDPKQVSRYTAPPRPDVSAEIAELQERCADTQWLASEWMARHDRIIGFISEHYPSVMLPDLPFPSPVPRPDASAGLIEAAENVVIAFGMGWDMEGVIERLIETLPQDSVCRARAAERSGK